MTYSLAKARDALMGSLFAYTAAAEKPRAGFALDMLSDWLPYRVFDESGIAAMVEMDPGDLVRLAAPGVFGPDPDIELSGVLAGMVEETGASESLFGYLLGLGAMGICKGQAERAGA